ncbi:MAG TPA: hypothetical protein HPP66_13100 [Planctomycetes bacterium]|nr:hypothetical protein [Planctomycetota bacterium]
MKPKTKIIMGLITAALYSAAIVIWLTFIIINEQYRFIGLFFCALIFPAAYIILLAARRTKILCAVFLLWLVTWLTCLMVYCSIIFNITITHRMTFVVFVKTLTYWYILLADESTFFPMSYSFQFAMDAIFGAAGMLLLWLGVRGSMQINRT